MNWQSVRWVALGLMLAAGMAQAQTYYYFTNINSAWNINSNWVDGVAPVAGIAVKFNV